MQNKHPRTHGHTFWLQNRAAFAATARSRLQLVSTCYQMEPKFWHRSSATLERDALCLPLINEPFEMKCVPTHSKREREKLIHLLISTFQKNQITLPFYLILIIAMYIVKLNKQTTLYGLYRVIRLRK